MSKAQHVQALTSAATAYLSAIGGAQAAKLLFIEAIRGKKPDAVASAIASAINGDTEGLKAARSERRKALLKATNEVFAKEYVFSFQYNKKQESYSCAWETYEAPTETEEQLPALPEVIELEISEEVQAQPVNWAQEAQTMIESLLATAPADANKQAIKSLKAALTALSK